MPPPPYIEEIMPTKKLKETKKQETLTFTEEQIAKVEKPIKTVKVMPEMVWVKVRNNNDSGKPIGPFFYADEAKGIPRTKFFFLHDRVHPEPIPREVMNHINDSRETQYENIKGELGTRSVPKGYKYLYQCIEVKKP